MFTFSYLVQPHIMTQLVTAGRLRACRYITSPMTPRTSKTQRAQTFKACPFKPLIQVSWQSLPTHMSHDSLVQVLFFRCGTTDWLVLCACTKQNATANIYWAKHWWSYCVVNIGILPHELHSRGKKQLYKQFPCIICLGFSRQNDS